MTKLEQIEKAVAGLAPDELRNFRTWFWEFEAELWDRQIERDATESRLDELAKQALAEHRAGETDPL